MRGANVSTTRPTVFFVDCGDGCQILRWIGYVSCDRLVEQKGESIGKYVPTEVREPDGPPLDPDLIISACLEDGAELVVEYSTGPRSFTSRWAGRPKSPAFQWGLHGAEVPPHDSWLREAELRSDSRVLALASGGGGIGREEADDDFEKLRECLLMAAGGVQSILLWMEAESGMLSEAKGLSRLNFRSYVQSVDEGVESEICDAIYEEIVMDKKSLARKWSCDVTAKMDLHDFLFALLAVACRRRYVGPQVFKRFSSFWTDCCSKSVLGEIRNEKEKIAELMSEDALDVLKRTRRRNDLVLESCQAKRMDSSKFSVELQFVAKGTEKWGLLEREFSESDFGLMSIFAKHGTKDPSDFRLQEEPLSLDCDEFERLLFAAGVHVCLSQKKKDELPQFLEEFLTALHTKAGVLH